MLYPLESKTRVVTIGHASYLFLPRRLESLSPDKSSFPSSSKIDPPLTHFCLKILVIRCTLNFDNATKRKPPIFFFNFKAAFMSVSSLVWVRFGVTVSASLWIWVWRTLYDLYHAGMFLGASDGEGTLCDSIGVVIIIR